MKMAQLKSFLINESFISIITLLSGVLQYIVAILEYTLTEIGYVLICQVKEKEKKTSFENAFVERREGLTRNKNGLVEKLMNKDNSFVSIIR